MSQERVGQNEKNWIYLEEKNEQIVPPMYVLSNLRID